MWRMDITYEYFCDSLVQLNVLSPEAVGAFKDKYRDLHSMVAMVHAFQKKSRESASQGAQGTEQATANGYSQQTQIPLNQTHMQAPAQQ
ncbi:hypothetical protein SARC_14261, partial [Sphaeroforma arctica JP610]